MRRTEGAWIEDLEEDSGEARRRRTMLAVAAVALPWLAVVGLLATGAHRGTVDHEPLAETVSKEPSTDGGRPHASGTPPFPAHGDTGGGLTLTAVQGGWRAQAGTDAAVALATVVAHDWLAAGGAQGSVGDVPGPEEASWVEHLALEAVEQLDDELAVVTMVAALATSEDGAGVRVRRLAVPVRVDGRRPRAAGPPWPLPEEEPATEILEGAPVTDPFELLAAHRALEMAGYHDVELLSLEQTGSWPWIARVEATTPAGVEVRTPVLLRRHLDAFVVAGTVLPAPEVAAPPPADAPNEPEVAP